MKRFLPLTLIILLVQACQPKEEDPIVNYTEPVSISAEKLADKIQGGWAGQVIGVTYGGPTEFKFNGTFIQDYQDIHWDEGMLKEWFEKAPGLYDDVYMDLTFVDVFEKYGLDAPVDCFARAFAHAGYPLWHANQAARYNILNDIMPPASGHWLNNPHADDIDFQIEADFAGLMSPGMVNTANEIADNIGHIMNSGDGWYGGVFVATMYSLAFLNDDPGVIVHEALRTIPEGTEFCQCISDVLKWHDQYPEDWKQNWFELQKKWSGDIGCPDGVFRAFDIDAKINAAYVAIGLLYGDGDFGRSMEISTRCGQDSDCNPATVGGILGTIMGYSNIPDEWKQGLADIDTIDFAYTDISLEDAYALGLKHAREVIARNGGSLTKDEVVIIPQEPVKVRFEQNFNGLVPRKRIHIYEQYSKDKSSWEIEFTGAGCVLTGRTHFWHRHSEKVNGARFYIDDELVHTGVFPVSNTTRRDPLFWNYTLEDKEHRLRIEVIEPVREPGFHLNELVVYGRKE